MSQLTVQLPDPLIADARKLAEQQHLTLEDFVAKLVADSVRVNAIWANYVDRGRQVSRERFLGILGKAPNVEPDADDRIN
jgi:hypothetical protein